MRFITFLSLFFLCVIAGRATNYYSDPSVAGSMSNAGSATKPWANLASIFTANKTFVAGDTIFLRTGNHGYVTIKGSNTGFVVIIPAAGHQPVIERIRVGNGVSQTDYWKLLNLKIQSESTNLYPIPSYFLVDILQLTSHITVAGCTITSSSNTSNWTRNDWRFRCNNGIYTRPVLNAFHVIEDNLIQNTAFGMQISSSNTIVRRNTVQNFTNDGSRVLASNILFEKNKIFDLIKVMSYTENHDDIFQAYCTDLPNLGVDTLKNVIIRQNIFVNTTDTTRAFRGSAQGIGCFSGPLVNWTVENNVVMVDHWHGISLYGASNCKVINNTVLDPYTYTPIDPYDLNRTDIGPAWILIDSVSGMNCSGNVVRNNLVSNTITIRYPSQATVSNNMNIGDSFVNFNNYFVNVSNPALPGYFDLHLKTNCAAIDAGTTLNAPTVDFENTSRPQGTAHDVGAFEFQKKLTTISAPSSNEVAEKYSIRQTATGIIIEQLSYANIRIFSINGQCLANQNVYKNYAFELQKGIYIITINGNTSKFIKY